MFKNNIVANYTNTLNSKVLYPLLVCIVILILFDITTRLSIGEANEQTSWESDNIKPPDYLKVSPQQAKKIITIINNYEQAEIINANKVKGMSEAEKLAQQGDLDKIYVGDMRYLLVGIFKEAQAFAVVQQQNVKTRENKLIQITISDKLDIYQVNEILANKVILQSDDGRRIDLFLYKTNNMAINDSEQK
ncbi:hypothetical protein [Thalassotalea agariperforans]